MNRTRRSPKKKKKKEIIKTENTYKASLAIFTSLTSYPIKVFFFFNSDYSLLLNTKTITAPDINFLTFSPEGGKDYQGGMPK